MTVCIAAIYEGGKGVVLSSDQMVTAMFPIGYEFQHQDIHKIIRLTSESDQMPVYALSSGDVLMGTEILALAMEQAAQLGSSVTAKEITEVVRQLYQERRRASVMQLELEPRGLTLPDFQNKQQVLAPQIVQIVDSAMIQFDLGVEFIIAGLTGSKYTIHTVVNPGVAREHSPIGYCAIGSGAPHAIYSLIASPYKLSLERDAVKAIVVKAKEQSEVAPGVGSATETKVVEEVSHE